jgi:DNA-binding NarL/FixJ family response regulator
VSHSSVSRKIQAFPDVTDDLRMPCVSDEGVLNSRSDRDILTTEVVGEAEDGLAAVEKTAVLKQDLVILNFRMPNLNGLQAGQTIHTANPRIPLLLFTLDGIAPPWEELAFRAGFRRRHPARV